MTTSEMSDAFTTLLNSFNTKALFGNQDSGREIVLDEYEKSIFLTKAQEELVVGLYNGKNPFGESFESTEELRRYLEGLVKTKVYNRTEETNGTAVSFNSIFFTLPDNLAFITMEQVIYDDDSLGCANGNLVTVVPATQDEYGKIKNNPFRGPTKYRVIRLDHGDNKVELVSKYNIKEYLIRYLSKPTPIILEDLPNGLTIDGIGKETECMLNNILHDTILNRAVQLAIQSKSIGAGK